MLWLYWLRGGTARSLARDVVVNDYHKHQRETINRWHATWFRRPNVPGWSKQVHSWQQIHICDPEDTLRWSYRELVDIGRECARHGVGTIQLTGWNDGGQDRGNPSHKTDPRLGTWEELRDAIAEIHNMGVKLVLFSKFTWADRSTEWYSRELHQYATKDPYGEAHWHMGYQYQTMTQLTDINTRRFAPMCHNSSTWRSVALKEFSRVVELGAAGMLYDECQHHWPARYCFDPQHDHHTRIEGDEHTAFQRYIDPELGMMVAASGFNERRVLNQCLLYSYIISYESFNFKSRIKDFPLTLEYGKSIDSLRRRYRDYLWNVEYRDTLGAAVTVDGKPHSPYTVFRQVESGKQAVVIVNLSLTEAVTPEIALDSPTPGTRPVMATPEDPEARGFNGTVTIPPRSAVVIMEQ